VNILVTGGGGMLGSVLVPVLALEGHSVVNTDLTYSTAFTHLDVRSRAQVRAFIDTTRPDIVLHLAACTSLEGCENEPDVAWHTNALGTRYVAQECRRVRIPMVYISSAGIFDGEQDAPYTEFDVPNPINVYGKSKWEGEQIVRETLMEHFIVRAGWMMAGGPEKDHKFVSHVTKQILAGVTRIPAVDDLYGSPTYALDLSRTLADLIKTRNFGTYHMVSGGVVSRYDVARAIVSAWGRPGIDVIPVPSTHFDTQFFARRPTSESMRNMILELEGHNTMRPWQEAVAEYVQEWFS